VNSAPKIIFGIIGAIIGAIAIGLIMGFIIGPIDTGNSNFTEAISEIGTLLSQPEESETLNENETYDESANGSVTGIGNIVRSRIISTTHNDNDDDAGDDETVDEDEDDSPTPPHPIVGSWETTALAEVDIEITGSIAEIRHFFEDGTGIEYHNESTQRREFAWRIENNRLTITPVDTSFIITTNSFEISDDTLTIFYNTNRTSYSEAVRIRNSEY
jgi:hypothetical protein